jgi:hypothetical protein
MPLTLIPLTLIPLAAAISAVAWPIGSPGADMQPAAAPVIASARATGRENQLWESVIIVLFGMIRPK